MIMGVALALLAGCGVAETGVTAAAGAAAKAKEAEAARDTRDRVQERLDAASQQAAQRLEQVEATER
jgi:hypothetical protein